jgi:hypothetical protein
MTLTDLSDTDELTLRLTPPLAAAIDRYIAESAVGHDRAGAIVQVVREWALAEGYMTANDDGLRPEQLSAANDD